MDRDRISGDDKNPVLAAFTVSILILVSAVVVLDLYRQPLGVDFAPVWAAATVPHEAYDVQAVTAIQSGLFAIDNLAPRPFAYPPTTLLLLLPLGFLSFWNAYVAFIGVSSVLFLLALRSSSVSPWAMAFPPVVLLLHVGQVTFLVGSLLLLALASSSWVLRGALLAVVVALKPQLAIFMPVLLFLQRDWRSAATACTLLSLIVAVSIGAFGFGFWKEWSRSLSELVQVVNANPGLAANQISGSWVFLPISLIAVWTARKADPATQLALVTGAALLISPYAMNYELALLVPAIAKRGFQRDKLSAASALILATGLYLILLPVLLITLGFLVWRTWAGKPEVDETTTSSASKPVPLR